MKIVFYIVLVILVVLAVASGITKIMLMEQEVEFFGQYGFSNLLLRSFVVGHSKNQNSRCNNRCCYIFGVSRFAGNGK